MTEKTFWRKTKDKLVPGTHNSTIIHPLVVVICWLGCWYLLVGLVGVLGLFVGDAAAAVVYACFRWQCPLEFLNMQSLCSIPRPS